MADFTRVNLYGKFALCKDHIARDTANTASNIANNAVSLATSANSKVTDAQEKIESLETEYNNFKEKNSYYYKASSKSVNISVSPKSSFSIPIQLTHDVAFSGNQKILLIPYIRIYSGDMVSSGVSHSFYVTAQINGSSSKRIRNGCYVPPENYFENSNVLLIDDITFISQISLSVYSYEGFNNCTVECEVSVIPIASEVKADE